MDWASCRRLARERNRLMRAAIELLYSRRQIALGKLSAFSQECRRLADLASQGAVERTAAIDVLHEASITNRLDDLVGVDRIQQIMADAFHGTATFVVPSEKTA